MRFAIILASSLRLGELFARAHKFKPGSYRATTPQCIDNVRGCEADRLFVLRQKDMVITEDQLAVIKQCFIKELSYTREDRRRNSKRFKVTPLGDPIPEINY